MKIHLHCDAGDAYGLAFAVGVVDFIERHTTRYTFHNVEFSSSGMCNLAVLAIWRSILARGGLCPVAADDSECRTFRVMDIVGELKPPSVADSIMEFAANICPVREPLSKPMWERVGACTQLPIVRALPFVDEAECEMPIMWLGGRRPLLLRASTTIEHAVAYTA